MLYPEARRKSPRGIMTKVLDCGLEISEFECYLQYYVHFQNKTHGKGMKPLILPAMGSIISVLFFYKDGFGMK